MAEAMISTSASTCAEPSSSDPAEAAALEAATRRWAADRVDAAAWDRAGRIPTAVLEEAGALGLFGLRVPERFGGLGLGAADTARVLAALAERDRALATTLGLHAGLGLEALRRFGGEEARSAWLPRAATGETIAAFAATEPGAGSHIAGVSTAGRPTGDGRWRVRGDKIFVTNGGFAGVFTVLARRPDGPALVLIPRSAEGVTVGPEERKMGLKASSTTSLMLGDVPAADGDWLGAGQGLDALHAALAVGRTFMAAGCVGSARAALALTAEHVATRRQFGRRLIEFGLVRDTLAGMAADVFAVETALAATVARLDAGEEAEWETSALKVLASETAWNVADQALQLHGGSGFIEDVGVARILRDTRVTRIFEGANDVLRLRLGTAVLKGVRGRLPGGAKAGDGRLDEAVRHLRRERGLRVLGDQRALWALGDAGIASWAAAAARTSAGNDPLAELALVRAERRTRTRLEELSGGDTSALSEAVLAGFQGA